MIFLFGKSEALQEESMVQHWAASEDRVFGIGMGWSKNASLTELETRKWLYLLVFVFYTLGIFGSMWDCLIQGVSQPLKILEDHFI